MVYLDTHKFSNFRELLFIRSEETVWLPLAFVVGPSMIAILSVWFGEGGWTLLDRFCLIVVGIDIVLWFLLKTPQAVLLVGILNSLLGTLPTIKKSYLRPQTESKLAWGMYFIGSIANIIAIDNWNFSIAMYPVSIFFGGWNNSFPIVFMSKQKNGEKLNVYFFRKLSKRCLWAT